MKQTEGEDTLAIGVTGHRFLAEMGKVTAGVDRALRIIRTMAPYHRLVVLSQLAEGADRLVARRAMLHHAAELTAVLPMEAREYCKDFLGENSVAEFDQLLTQAVEVVQMPPARERNDTYSLAGRYVLEHSQILIAIWDGKSAQGVGGTGEIITLARQRKLPVCWVHAGNRIPGTSTPISLGSQQGKLTLERFRLLIG